MEDECNFGNLRDIIVPPYAVSVPRIDMNKETILGIPNRSKCRSNSNEWSSTMDFKQAEQFSENQNQQTSSKTSNNQSPNNNNHENLFPNQTILNQPSSTIISNGNVTPQMPVQSVQPAQTVAITTMNVTGLSVQVTASPSSLTSSPCGGIGNSKTNNSTPSTSLNAGGSSKKKEKSKQQAEEEEEKG